jgi:sugar phosphate isomerase/epimerase
MDVTSGTTTHPDLVLWSGTVRTASLTERVAAASAAGYRALSLSPPDYLRARADGLSDADIRVAVADAGLRVSCLDPFTRWLPTWEPFGHLSSELRALLGTEEADFFRVAEAVGASSMTVFEPFGVRWPPEVLAACLAAVCRRAESSGLRVNLEFIPFLGVPDLATAWRVVRQSGAANAGIVLDTWHYFRGTPDDDLLESIPGARIGAVQVSDAARVPVGSMEIDCLHHRRCAGDGAFPLHEVREVLRRTGGLNDVGPEIFSDRFDGRPAQVNAMEALRGLDTWRPTDASQPAHERKE